MQRLEARIIIIIKNKQLKKARWKVKTTKWRRSLRRRALFANNWLPSQSCPSSSPASSTASLSRRTHTTKSEDHQVHERAFSRKTSLVQASQLAHERKWPCPISLNSVNHLELKSSESKIVRVSYFPAIWSHNSSVSHYFARAAWNLSRLSLSRFFRLFGLINTTIKGPYDTGKYIFCIPLTHSLFVPSSIF